MCVGSLGKMGLLSVQRHGTTRSTKGGSRNITYTGPLEEAPYKLCGFLARPSCIPIIMNTCIGIANIHYNEQFQIAWIMYLFAYYVKYTYIVHHLKFSVNGTCTKMYQRNEKDLSHYKVYSHKIAITRCMYTLHHTVTVTINSTSFKVNVYVDFLLAKSPYPIQLVTNTEHEFPS